MLKKIFEDKILNIGYSKIGGLGDTIQALILSKALKRKYPSSSLTLYIRDKNDIWKRTPHISNIIYTGYCNWEKIRKKEAQKYELFFDDIYVIGKYVKGKLAIKKGLRERYLTAFENPNKVKGNILEESANNLKVELKEEDFDLSYLISNNKIEKIIQTPYIILHNGRHKLRATKSYPSEKYEQAIQTLLKVCKIYQVGKKEEPKIKGTIDLRNKLNLEELFSIVRGAKLVITQEGALAHVARVMNTKALVLFGATIIDNFGYKENINIEGNLECKGCWYSTSSWYKYCPKKLPKQVDWCDSIKSIPPEEITKKALLLF